MADARSETQRLDRYLLLVLAIGIGFLWIWPLGSSFWLDETITGWITQGNFFDTIHRSLNFQAISPLYYVVAWMARELLGGSEVALRIPSALAAGGTTILVYRLGRRLIDRDAGLIAAVVFATSFGGSYAAGDARPYAMALLVLTAFTLALIRWLDTGRWQWAAATMALGALVGYVHYLFLAAMPAHALYAWLRVRSERRISRLRLLILAMGVAILLVPMLPHLVSTAHRRDLLSLPSFGSIGAVLISFMPPFLLVGCLVGVALASIQDRLSASLPTFERKAAIFAAVWAVSPPILLTIASHVLGAGVFAPRYLLSSLPAQCLIAATAIRGISPRGARRVVVVTVVIVSFLSIGVLQHTDDVGWVEQWREAISHANEIATPAVPMLVDPGLAESRDITLVRDPTWMPYLLAPVRFYPTDVRPVLLPPGTNASERAYLEAVVRNHLTQVNGFVLLVNNSDALVSWIEARTAPLGFVDVHVWDFGDLKVVQFAQRA